MKSPCQCYSVDLNTCFASQSEAALENKVNNFAQKCINILHTASFKRHRYFQQIVPVLSNDCVSEAEKLEPMHNCRTCDHRCRQQYVHRQDALDVEETEHRNHLSASHKNDVKCTKKHDALTKPNRCASKDINNDNCADFFDCVTTCSTTTTAQNHKKDYLHFKIIPPKDKNKNKTCDFKGAKENNFLNSWKSFFSKWMHDSKSSKDEKAKSNDTLTCESSMKIIVTSNSAYNSNSSSTASLNEVQLTCVNPPSFAQEFAQDIDVCNLSSMPTLCCILSKHTKEDEDLLNQSCQTDSTSNNRPMENISLENWKTQVDYNILSKQNPRLCKKHLLQTHGQLIQTISCPTKSKSFQSQNSKLQKNVLSSSWPSCFHQTYFTDSDDELGESNGARKNSFGRYQLQEYEFNIPFSDIKFHECVQNGKKKKLYRGQWHGEVMIHLFENLNHEERGYFWQQISRLSLIRHENISLFMGASMEPPNFAVVTSARKGPSLYDKMHILREKAASSLKLSILQQIAQAVGYLHAKGMIAALRLNSKNIFLEPRAKLCLIDSIIIDDACESNGYVSLSPTLVYYISPEILAMCSTGTPRRVSKLHFSTASDVFAFSTIMFEVYCGRYPFHTLEVDSFIVNICRGKREDIRHLRTSDIVKHLIQDGWMHDPLYRPDFADINGKLKNRKALYKPCSTSEPENLHRLNNYKLGHFV